MKYLITLLIAVTSGFVMAQTTKIAALAIDTKGNITSEEATALTRVELQKFNGFIVLDSYDVDAKLKQAGILPTECYNTECLIKAGEAIQAEQLVTGSIYSLNNNIVVSLRLISVAKKDIIAANIVEFRSIAGQTQNQIKISLAQLLKQPYDKELFEKLKRDESMDKQLVQPAIKQLNLSGPRMGITYIFGEAEKIIKAPVSSGGFNANPLMFQLGYQFEKQYLNSGKYQALFEIIPMATGIDQNFFIPSLSLLHGLRNNTNGWEFGVGAVFSIASKADMFLYNGQYYLYDDWRNVLPAGSGAPTDTESRLNSKGTPTLMTAIVLAVGKSFSSGSLNIPVALFAMPQKDGVRLGLSVGFNGKNK